jgi:plasmid maintenance system antidote protein VapI
MSIETYEALTGKLEPSGFLFSKYEKSTNNDSKNTLCNNRFNLTTQEIALRLSRFFGNSAEFRLNAQCASDLWTAGQAAGPDIKRVEPLVVV